MSTIELEPIVKHALKLLHSTSPDSAEKIRQSLDEILKQKHGSNKMLINTINKKYIAEEINVPGTIKRQKSSDSRSTISTSGKNNSPISTHHEPLATSSVPVTTTESSIGVIPIEISSDSKNIDITEEENLKDFGDLACVVCGAMVFAAGNRLVECADCHSLFHQECHKPPITDDDANEQEFSWCCTNCKNKAVMSKTSLSAASTSSSTTAMTTNIINSFSIPSPSPSKSSSSSTSSSPHYKNFQESSSSNNPSSNTNKSNKSTSSSSSSSSSNSNNSSTKNNGNNSNSSPGTTKTVTGNSSGGGVSTPRINIITVDKRLQIMKKKAAKQNESKRKK